MTMAKVLPASLAISSRMKGNFCTVETMIFLPSWMKRRRSPERSAWPDRRADLHELPDRRLDLLVEQAPVGDHDDRVEDLPIGSAYLIAVALQPDELVCQPGDGVRLAAARRVLDQVTPAGTVRTHVGQRLAHDAELVVARPNLTALLPAAARVLFLDDLRVVLDDVGQPRRGEHFHR
jgi:hypothetical protein